MRWALSLRHFQRKKRAQDSDHGRLVDPTRGREPPIPVPLLLMLTPVPSPRVGPATHSQRTVSPGTLRGPRPYEYAALGGVPSWPSLVHLENGG